MDKKISCLIVDDDFVNRKVYKCILDNMKIIYDEVFDGMSAIDMIVNNKDKFDFIIMDIRMPLCDGIDASVHIKKEIDIPIIICTADVSPNIQDKLKDIKIEEFLIKPTGINKIKNSINKLITKYNLDKKSS